MGDQQSLRSACAYAQSDQSLCKSPEYSMNIKQLTGHNVEFLSLTGDCTGSSEYTLVKCHIVDNHMSRLNFLYPSIKILVVLLTASVIFDLINVHAFLIA